MHRHVRRRTRASLARHAVVLLGLTLLGPGPADARAEEPSVGVLLRRARYALAEGRRDEAAVALRAARRAEPRTRRGLEAALLLADLELTRGDGAAADDVLAGAERDFPEGEAGAQVLLARGWVAVARPDPAAALRHFGLVPMRSGERYATELAQLGSAWARLIGAAAVADVPAELHTLSGSARDPVLRIAALLSLARAHGARGEHKQALRKLRALRRIARGTSFADDVELAIGLTQLDLGAPAAARRTFRRLAEQPAVPRAAWVPSSQAALTLADLRLPPRDFAARVARLYAARAEPTSDVLTFLAGTLDRDARRDATAALSLAHAAIAARKEA